VPDVDASTRPRADPETARIWAPIRVLLTTNSRARARPTARPKIKADHGTRAPRRSKPSAAYETLTIEGRLPERRSPYEDGVDAERHRHGHQDAAFDDGVDEDPLDQVAEGKARREGWDWTNGSIPRPPGRPGEYAPRTM
jgi:hypothetical protein